MLCAEDTFVPGYGPQQALSMRVLGPVPEKGPAGERWLLWFGSAGETKNGHSVILQVRYGLVMLMLGGNLNSASEKYFLEHYTGLDPEPKSAVEEEMLVRAARRTFASDIAKACRHGSGDFSELYLQTVDAAVTVLSSGDNEPYSHPRSDALGALGKYGRGLRPLIFSAELARSAKENIKHPYQLRARIKALVEALALAETESQRNALQKKLDIEISKIERSIAVY